MFLLANFILLYLAAASVHLAPALHGAQPSPDDWLPVIFVGSGFVVIGGLALYSYWRNRQLALSDKPNEEKMQ